MKIIRTINAEKVRKHCIEHNYYTCGNNKDYSTMLDKCDHYDRKEATDADILEIGRDIWSHSDMEDFIASGGTFADFLWGIFNKCLLYNIRED